MRGRALRRPRRLERKVEGRLGEVLPNLPEFELRQFSANLAPLQARVPANPRYRAVVDTRTTVPVGLVSPDYHLVQHRDVLTAVLDALTTHHGLDAARCETRVALSPLGEQMLASVFLGERWPALELDGQPLLVRLVVANSVDGLSALRVALGWFRLVCLNGMVVPQRAVTVKRRHVPGLCLGDIADAVSREFGGLEESRAGLVALGGQRVEPAALVAFVDGPLRDAWGAQAATRVFHVASRGVDVDLASTFDAAPPSRKQVRDCGPAPGSLAPARDRYALLQALSFVASRSENLVQRWRWESEAMELVRQAA